MVLPGSDLRTKPSKDYTNGNGRQKRNLGIVRRKLVLNYGKLYARWLHNSAQSLNSSSTVRKKCMMIKITQKLQLQSAQGLMGFQRLYHMTPIVYPRRHNYGPGLEPGVGPAAQSVEWVPANGILPWTGMSGKFRPLYIVVALGHYTRYKLLTNSSIVNKQTYVLLRWKKYSTSTEEYYKLGDSHIPNKLELRRQPFPPHVGSLLIPYNFNKWFLIEISKHYLSHRHIHVVRKGGASKCFSPSTVH